MNEPDLVSRGLSIVSLVVSLIALAGLWFQREANRIALRTFEREHFPQITVQWQRQIDINFDPPREMFLAVAINEGKHSTLLESVGIGSAKGEQFFALAMVDRTAPDPRATFPHELQPERRLMVSTELAGVVALLNEHGGLLGDKSNVQFKSQTGKSYGSRPIRTTEMIALLGDPDFWSKQARARPFLEKMLGLKFPESWKTPEIPKG